jgi:branched-chain amino acid transport system permease protein
VDLTQFAQSLINGLLLGGIYALLAAGLTLIFGVMRVINFAHGEFMMLGGMATYWLSALYGVNPLLSLLVVLPAGLLFGAVVQATLVGRVVNAPPMMSLLLTFGLSFFLIGLAQTLWGNLFRSVPYLEGSWVEAGIALPRMRFVAFVGAALLTGAVYVFLQHTRQGKAIRATAQHAEVAMTCGIDVTKVRRNTFAIGSAMGVVAGSLLVTIVAIHPQVGALYILKSFAIVVLGGLGSFTGALLGGLILGLVEVFGTLYVSSAVGQASAYLVLLVVLLVRPGGLLGVGERVRA